MNKHTVVWIAVCLLLLFLVFLWSRRRYSEGFEVEQADVNNILINLVSQMKRITSNLADPKMLMDRLDMASMSPVELARRHLQQSKDGQ